MALKRNFLTAMGIDADKVDEIINAHSETVDALKTEIEDLKKKASNAEALQKELDEANAKIKDLDKEDTYKVKYDALKEDFEEYKKGIEAEKTKAVKADAFKALLKEIGISEKGERFDNIVRISNLDNIKLDKDGKIEGVEDLKKSLTEEWGDFIVKKSTEGAKTANPPQNTGGSGMKKEDIEAIKDTATRQKAILENRDMFGI